MIAYKIPKNDDAVFCALFESFTMKERPIAVFSGSFQPSFDCQVKNISYSKNNADRVRKGIIKCGGISLLSSLFYVMRSDDDLMETIVFNAAYKCLAARKNVTDDFKDPDMLAFFDLKNKIALEAHRMTGFVRFEKSQGGIWYSHIEPDNNIVDLIAPHFRGRFPNERFILHDIKRNILSAYNGKDLITLKSDKPITVYLDKEEIEFQGLWQTYFNHVAVMERKNPRLQANYLPHRYRRNMNEFLGRLDSEVASSPDFLDDGNLLPPDSNA